MDQKSHAPRSAVIAAITAGIAVLAVYLLRLDRVAGLIVDDAWYVLLARALAEGRGYRLISSATTELLPVVPPGFPLVLSAVFRLSPDFPSNIFLLKAVSIASMLGVGVASGWYFLRWRNVPWTLALAIAVAVTLTPAAVFLATSTVMSECLFMLGQIVALIAVERSAVKTGQWRGRVIAAAVASAATMLVRTAGIAMVAAAILYLVKERLWRRAALFAVVAMACALPWTLYARAHAPTREQRVAHGGSIVYPYGDSMRLRIASNPDSGLATPEDLARRIARTAVTIFGRDMAGVVVPGFLRGASESGQELISIGFVGDLAGSMGNAPATLVISFVLSGVMLLGWVAACRNRVTAAEILTLLSVAMIVLVPFQTFRYTLTLAPFLFFYLVTGTGVLTAAAGRWLGRPFADPMRVARLMLACMIGLAILDHAQYLAARFSGADPPAVDWIAESQEIDQVLDWMNAHLDEGAVASTNPALVFLKTGRKTVALDGVTERWRIWKTQGIRYIVSTKPIEKPNPSVVSYRVLFETRQRKFWVLEI